jgi:hypothetical protein
MLCILIISFLISVFNLFCLHMTSMISVSSLMETFEYMVSISDKTNFKFLWNGISRRSSISWIDFLILNMYGNGMNVFSFLVSIFESSYVGASFQLTMGWMGDSVLCIFIKPLTMGGDGFKFTYFHFSSYRNTRGHLLTLFLGAS